MDIDKLITGKSDITRTMLVDFSNISYASFYSTMASSLRSDTTEDIYAGTRYIVLKSLMNMIKKFSPDEVVLCCDNGSWRKNFFKYYKARRKFNVDSMSKEEFYEIINGVRDEIKENFPYKVVSVENAEGDDVIGILTEHLHLDRDDVIIISRDKDFAQLRRYDNVSIYNPIDDKDVVTDPHESLFELTLRGDSGDDIPNLLSPDNIFLDPDHKQKSITKKVIESVNEVGLDMYAEFNDLTENLKRNQTLVTLSSEFIPEDIVNAIKFEYDNVEIGRSDYTGIKRFFMNNNIQSLIDNVGDFMI